MVPLHGGAAFLNAANCEHFHGVDHDHAVRFRGRVNHGKFSAAKNHAVAPLLAQMGAHLVERAHVRGAATLHVVVNNAHDLRLVFGIGQHRLQATCLELVLQHARVPRAVGRHDTHATLARKGQIARRFARHVHQMRRLQASRPFVAAIMPGHARCGEHLASQILKLKRGLVQRRQI